MVARYRKGRTGRISKDNGDDREGEIGGGAWLLNQRRKGIIKNLR